MKQLSIALAAVCLGLWGCDGDSPSETDANVQAEPTPTEITRATLFDPNEIVWSHQHMAEIFPARTISKAPTQSTLKEAPLYIEGLTYSFGGDTHSFKTFLKRNNSQGIVVLHQGNIVYERYFGKAHEGTQFASWSVAKSITSTLVGIAIGDGLISSVDDRVSDYVTDLKGTAYEHVTVKQVLQMSSGVEFNETYEGDDEADIITYFMSTMFTNAERANEAAASFPRGQEAGTTFNYNTAETQILGWLLTKVTGKPLSEYLEKKIWQPLGMSHDATWLLDRPGREGMEMAGCCINASLRDYAKIGQLYLQDGVWNNLHILPRGWVLEATTPSAPHLQFTGRQDPAIGYQYLWWVPTEGTYVAEGVRGQFIYVDPSAEMVIASAATWPTAWSDEKRREAHEAFAAVADVLRDEEQEEMTSQTIEFNVLNAPEENPKP